MENILDHLNELQKEAVKATEGRIRVVAGAGSGKTRVLANRYAYLVEKIGIDPANIVCLTFTNKAAQEMKTRIRKIVNLSSINDFICTIHGFCVKILRREIYKLGYPSYFTIIDEDDCKRLVKQAMEEFGLDRTNITADQQLDEISAFKSHSNLQYIRDYFAPNADDEQSAKKSIIVRYFQLQLKYYALDFSDIVYFAIYLLETYPDSLAHWQNEINYLLVDEVQDCSNTDWRLIYLLSGKYNNIFVVGDPDQAIYEWRGAKPDLFLKFKHDKEVILDENYRSTQTILNVANSIIDNNQFRVKKSLHTNNLGDTITIYHHGKSEKEEGEWVTRQIKKLMEFGNKESDFAILFRASYISRFIEQALMSEQIQYVVWGGIKFFERKEIKDSLAYLRLIANKTDDLSFSRIINVPARKFGKVSLNKLMDIAKEDNCSLYDALKNHITEDPFNKEQLKDFIDIIEQLTTESSVLSISDLMNNILNKTGLKAMYRIDGDEDRIENINELLQSMRYYEELTANEEVSLNIYLQDVALFTNADYNKETSTVKLMTIHQAKGLEFPYVFIVGLTEGIFPNHRAIRNNHQKGLEEERRLMYVAVTRAEKALFLTESEGYNFSSKSNKYPSRFIREIKENLMQIDGSIDCELLKGTDLLVKQLNDEIFKNGNDEDSLDTGTKVEHSTFGIGEVIEYNEGRDSYIVNFGEITRVIMSKFLIVKD